MKSNFEKSTLSIISLFALKSCFFILLYFYIFQPPVINKLFYVALGFFTFLFFLFSKPNLFLKYVKRFRYELAFGLSFVFISIFRDVVTGEIVYSDRFLIWFFQSLIFPFFVIYIFQYIYKKNFSPSATLVDSLYYVVIFASLLTVVLILFPAVDRFYESIQLDIYYELYKSFEFRYRAYGVAENLTFTYGYLLGLFAAYSLLKSRYNSWHLLFFMLLIVGVAFNARIGFFPVILVMVYLVTFGLSFRLLIMFSTFVFTVFFILVSVTEDISSFIYWPLMFFYELSGFFTSGDGGTVSTLFDDFIIIPEYLTGLFFGNGVSLFGLETGSSDVGYILQLNYAGIFFSLLIVLFFIFCSFRLGVVTGFRNWYFWLFTFSLFFLNTKGFLLAATPGARLLFLLYLYYIFTKVLCSGERTQVFENARDKFN